MDDDNLVSRVKKNKQLLFELSHKLRVKGYDIAETMSGKRVDEPQPSEVTGEYKSLGILVRAKAHILGIPIPFLKQWVYPADIWIDNQSRGAVPDEHWILDIYGKENVAKAVEIVLEIARPYGVEITAKVAIDELRFAGDELYWPELEAQAK